MATRARRRVFFLCVSVGVTIEKRASLMSQVDQSRRRSKVSPRYKSRQSLKPYATYERSDVLCEAKWSIDLDNDAIKKALPSISIIWETRICQ